MKDVYYLGVMLNKVEYNLKNYIKWNKKVI